MNATEERQLSQLLQKIKIDPAFFLETFCKIQHPTKGLIPFNLFNYQRDIIDIIQLNRFSIFLKARQLGFTTVVAGIALWTCLFFKDKTVLVLSKDKDAAKEINHRAKIMYNSLPAFFKKLVRLKVDNVYTTEFSNRSRIQSIGRTKTAGRSKALSLLIVDEAAAIDNFEEIYAAIHPTISTGGKCVIMSTPAGRTNLFAKLYLDAEAGLNKYAHGKYSWNVHPDHDQKWFDEETKNYRSWQIAQEFLCDFGTSANTVLRTNVLDSLIPKDPIRTGDHDRNLWYWQMPQVHKAYVVSVDVSRGDGKDYQAIQVLESEKWEQVAEYKGYIIPNEVGKMSIELAKEYNNAYIIVDNTVGWGQAVLDEIILNQKYQNVYCSDNTGKLFTLHEYIGSSHVVSAHQGFQFTVKTRPATLLKLEQAFDENLLILHSLRLINELKSFVWKNGKPQADSSSNDDLIMALALNIWAMQKTTKKLISAEAAKKMLDSIYVDNRAASLREEIKDLNLLQLTKQFKDKAIAEQIMKELIS